MPRVPRRWSLLLLLVLLGLGLLQAAWYYPQLPAQVASHFGAGGQADGWMSKLGMVAATVGVQVALAVLFLGIAWVVPRVPMEYVNLPHREYWLAPERRAATIEFLQRQFWSFGAALQGLFLLLGHLTYRANLQAAPRLATAWMLPALGLFLAYSLAWCIYPFWRFRRPRAAP